MPTPPQTLYIGADNVLELRGWEDKVNSAYLNSGTVSGIVKTITGAEVSGVSWPVSMDYVPASDGTYRAVIDNDIVLSENVVYALEITAVEGEVEDFYRIPVVAKYKT